MLYSTLHGQIKGAGRDCICARVHPLSKHELVFETWTCIGVISGPLVAYKSVIPPQGGRTQSHPQRFAE